MNRDEALRKLQMTELDILLAIRDFCDEHGITWFLDGGTLIGAMRHGGFIPWDDDIDIGMPRADYDRFSKLAKEGIRNDLSFHDASNTPGYAAFFGKIWKDGTSFTTDESEEAGCPQGIFVDVFPYDLISSDRRRREQQISNARLWQSVSYLFHAKTIAVPHKGLIGAVERAGCRGAHYLIRGLFSEHAIRRHFEQSILDDGETNDGSFLSLSWPKIKPVPASILLPTELVTFEGESFPAPHDPDLYLQNMYGDWRAVPAPEERHTHLPRHLDFGDGTEWFDEE